MAKKIKVVWLCHLSNSEIRSHIKHRKIYYKDILCKLMRRQSYRWNDYAIWNTNAIREFEKYDDIDLTVVFPFAGMKEHLQRFNIKGVHYIAYRSEDDNLLSFFLYKILKKECRFAKNREKVKSLISEAAPDIVHVIGAENPYYSICALDIPETIPTIVSLQTLMSVPGFQDGISISSGLYEYRAKIEREVIRKCTYIGTQVTLFRDQILKNIKPKSEFLPLTLAVGVEIDTSYNKKEYDFVYFAANVGKAVDIAIEAFGIAIKEMQGLTLNISGGCDNILRAKLDKRIEELGVNKQVFFTGSQESHEKVLQQIKKSRFALLPLKVDQISSTIREAMACGLPVVTTITPATPHLNKDRESVLLSDKEDYADIAKNMLKLVSQTDFAEEMKNNAIQTVREMYSNESLMKRWHLAYSEITC